jgi:adenylate cyclase
VRSAPLAGLLVAVVFASFGLAHRSGWVGARTWARADLALLDLGLQARGPRPAGPDVVVVAVDDRSTREAPELIERRTGTARLVRAIHAAGAKVVALDFFLTDEEQLLSVDLTSDIRAWTDAPEPETPAAATELLGRVRQETSGDAELEAALKEAGAILAVHVGEVGGTDARERSLARGTYGQVVPGGALPAEGDFVLASLARFNAVASRLGAITVREDTSGVVRRVPLAVRLGLQHFVPLGLQLVAAHDGTPRGRLALVGSEGTARLGDRVVVGHGPEAELWLNWRGPAAFETIPAVDVIAPDFDRARLDGRIALVGYTYLSQDTVRTPFGQVPGVMVHATAADNALNDDFLRLAPAWWEAVLALVCGGLLAAVFAVPGGRSGVRVVGVFGSVGLAVGVPCLALTQDVWLGALTPLTAAGVGSLACVASAWLQDGAQSRALRKAFAHYVSDELIEVMAADPSMVQLRGQRRTLSVLFSDIRDFTSFSEQMSPLELVAFLNHYLTPMTRAVLAERGFVDKFIGDAVMAIFGAPVPDEDHASNACRAALSMWTALDQVRPEARRHGIELAIGVGVNTGEMAVGNMGSEERFEYTVMGDAVNLASRLEGLTKTYGVFCLLGPTTAKVLPARFRVRRLDLVRVKGKAEPVEIFELCGDDRVSVVQHVEPELWEAAVAAWRRGALADARVAFERFRASNPSDSVAGIYLERLAALGDEAPAGWDGVFTHTKK